MSKTIAEALTRIKEETGFIYTTVAKEVGLHASTIANYVKGKSVPTFETLEKIASALGVDVTDIDTSLRKTKDVVAPQPSHSKTRATIINSQINDWLEENHFTRAEFAELAEIDKKYFRDSLNHNVVMKGDVLVKIAEAMGLERDDLDPLFINGKEIELAKVVSLRARVLLAESNLKPNDIDRILGDKIGTFAKAFLYEKSSTGKLSVPRYAYIKKIAAIFDIDPAEIDPFTDPEIV